MADLMDLSCGPIVDVLGDGMANVLWERVKEKLIYPYIDIETYEFDLSIENRDATENQIVYDAIEAIKKYHVCAKCATMTAGGDEVKKFQLNSTYPAPNHTIRMALGGVVIREPIYFSDVSPIVQNWKKGISIVILAEEDIYEVAQIEIHEPGKLELVYTPSNPKNQSLQITVHDFKGKGVALALTSTERSIEHFAVRSFEYALEKRTKLYFSASNLLTIYDGRFAKVFQDLYDKVFKCKFIKAGISYKYVWINRMAKNTLQSEGGFTWALRYRDGDLFSSFLYGGFGVMSSTFYGKDKKTIIAENYYGPVTLFFNNTIEGEIPGFHPCDSIVAWAIALNQRAKLDENENLQKFAYCLEQANLNTILNGYITQDLMKLMSIENFKIVDSFQYVDLVNEELIKLFNQESG